MVYVGGYPYINALKKKIIGFSQRGHCFFDIQLIGMWRYYLLVKNLETENYSLLNPSSASY